MARWAITRFLLIWMTCLALCGLFGCDTQSGHRPVDQLDTADWSGAEADPTIVSLTPAITQMLIDMGKRDQFVGVSKEDDASLGLPVCGSYNNPVIARIIQLKPDIVLTESSTGRFEDAHEGLRDAAGRGLFELKVIPHSRSIADVQRVLSDPKAGLGAAVGDPEAARGASKLMAMRIDLVSAVMKDADRPRVLMLINPTKLGAIGTGVTHDELLRLAGGTNALAHVKTGYLELDRAMLVQTVRPDVVLILEPGGSELSDGDPRLRTFEGLSIPVNTSRRFAVIQHPQAMLPSTSLPEVMLEIALALHPDKAAEIREAYDTAAESSMQQPAGDGDNP